MMPELKVVLYASDAFGMEETIKPGPVEGTYERTSPLTTLAAN